MGNHDVSCNMAKKMRKGSRMIVDGPGQHLSQINPIHRLRQTNDKKAIRVRRLQDVEGDGGDGSG